MIETFNNADLFADLGLDADPIKPIIINDKTANDAESKINNLIGIAKTSEQEAEALSKELLGEVEDKEDKEDDKTNEEGESKDKKSEDDKSSEEDKESSEEQSYSFKAIVEYLDEEGILEYSNDLKDLEDNPELLAVSINKKIESGIDNYKESLPEVVADLVSFIELGGDPSKYLESLYRPIDPNELDLGQEADQELVVREYLKAQEFDAKDIDELIESYKDGLVLEKQAKVASKKLESIYSKQTEQLVKQQEAIVEENRKKSTEYIESIKSTINTSKSLAGLEIPDKEKKDFSEYLLKVNPKTNMTKYQEDLAQDYVKNSVELAYLKFKKYDFTKAKQEGKSDATKEMKNKIFKTNEKTISTGKSPNDNKAVDFSPFKKMFSNK